MSKALASQAKEAHLLKVFPITQPDVSKDEGLRGK